VPAVCASSLAEERSACPNLTLRSAVTPWLDPGERAESDIGRDSAAVGVQMKKAGKPRDQGGRSIDLVAGDGDVNVGSRARG